MAPETLGKYLRVQKGGIVYYGLDRGNEGEQTETYDGAEEHIIGHKGLKQRLLKRNTERPVGMGRGGFFLVGHIYQYGQSELFKI